MAYVREYPPGPDPSHDCQRPRLGLKIGEENIILVRLMIQRTGRHTSTKNLQEYLQLQHRFYPSSPQSIFIPSPQSTVHVLYLVPVLYPVHIFQSAFYTQSVFHTRSEVRSPQSMFYMTDIQPYLVSKDAIFFIFSAKYRVENKQTQIH